MGHHTNKNDHSDVLTTMKRNKFFLHTLLSNGLGGNKFNTLQSNIQSELKLGTKGIKKGDRYVIKYIREYLNKLTVTNQQA